MKTRVYVETSVLSYLTAAPSRDLIVAARQLVTREWWRRRHQFDLFVSELVIQEAAAGDPSAAALRIAALDGLPILQVDAAVDALAKRLVEAGALPVNAESDAIHLAIAAVHQMDVLLTWNYAHLANASVRGKMDHVCRAMRCVPPMLCTPDEFGAD